MPVLPRVLEDLCWALMGASLDPSASAQTWCVGKVEGREGKQGGTSFSSSQRRFCLSVNTEDIAHGAGIQQNNELSRAKSSFLFPAESSSSNILSISVIFFSLLLLFVYFFHKQKR